MAPNPVPHAARTTELLTQRLVRLLRLLDGGTARLLDAHDIRIVEWRVLAQIVTVENATVRSIAEALSISRSEASRAGTVLEERGLAVRLEDPADRRSVLLEATAAGRGLYEEIYPQRTAALGHLMEAVPAQDAATFDRVLDVLIATLEEGEAGAGRLRHRTGRRRSGGGS
ncbi:MarR family winged helix-turn-helix transcriptional regulator [Nocardioides fonticola]|uniref:MarR family winged helix-turn-helix transcriptional regulator n=1 Tax=Nocardioides fonticola TaxID=450363 RepID=UPI0031D1DD89